MPYQVGAYGALPLLRSFVPPPIYMHTAWGESGQWQLGIVHPGLAIETNGIVRNFNNGYMWRYSPLRGGKMVCNASTV